MVHKLPQPQYVFSPLPNASDFYLMYQIVKFFLVLVKGLHDLLDSFS